jgi:hypothetical protein
MTYPTSQKIADALSAEAVAPEHEERRQIMIRGALMDHYHDMFGHGPTPITELHSHCMAIGLTALAARVRDGEFDPTPEESEAWAQSLEGIDTMNKLSPGLGEALAGVEPAPMLGDAPIEERFRAMMNMMAEVNDSLLNGPAKGTDRKNGFVLLVFPFAGHDGRCNYISNGADRADIVVMLKEQIKRFEGQPDVVGNA